MGSRGGPKKNSAETETPFIAVTKSKHREVRILIADDHELIRRAVCQLFDHKSGLIVCGEAADGKQAVELFQKLEPDIVIMDITMPVMNGLDAAKEIRRRSPKVKIVILTTHDLAGIRGAVREVKIDGYVSKRDAAVDLLDLINSFIE